MVTGKEVMAMSGGGVNKRSGLKEVELSMEVIFARGLT